jgi:carbamoyltransferase
VDGTARPQIIFKNQDPFFYELIEQWHKETGELSLINTSFNIHEQPIIRTYQEGIFQLNKGVIDILMLENNIYKKN